MKIALAIVTNRLVKPKTVRDALRLTQHTEHELFPIVATEGYTTAEGRSYCAIQAKKEGCSHILFIDDDMTFPEDTLERLLAHGKEVVGVYSFSRVLPLSPTVAFLDDEGNYLPKDRMPFVNRPTELFKCYTIGMGVALIDMKVFEAIDKPWFQFTTHESGKVLIGEDAWFCSQAKKKGYEIWCDPTLDIGHIGDFIYGEDEEVDNQKIIIDYHALQRHDK